METGTDIQQQANLKKMWLVLMKKLVEYLRLRVWLRVRNWPYSVRNLGVLQSNRGINGKIKKPQNALISSILRLLMVSQLGFGPRTLALKERYSTAELLARHLPARLPTPQKGTLK